MTTLQKITLKHPETNPEDVSKLVQVEQLAWDLGGENLAASEAKIVARITAFQQGVTIAIAETCSPENTTSSGEIAGSQYAFVTNWNGDLDNLTSWDDLTNEGQYHEVHNLSGNTGFLVGVGVVPDFRGQKFYHNWAGSDNPFKVSELLIAKTLDTLFEAGVKQVIGNARVPAYHTMPGLGINEYCQTRRDDGKLYDPVLRFHERMGGKVLKPAEYSMEDPQSLNAGCWVIYEQPFNG